MEDKKFQEIHEQLKEIIKEMKKCIHPDKHDELIELTKKFQELVQIQIDKYKKG
jgi:ribonuclease HIII